MGDVADIDSSVGLPQEVVYTERTQDTEPQETEVNSNEVTENEIRETEALREATGLGNNIDVKA
jgi:hypothetical protein